MLFAKSLTKYLAPVILFAAMSSPDLAAAVETALATAPMPMPPAPDARAAPEAYEHWRKFVAEPFARGWIRSGRPLPSMTNSTPSPARVTESAGAQSGGAEGAPVAPGVVRQMSENWSGAVYHDKTQNPFKVEAIIGEFVTPNARQPLGVCDSRHSSYWVGIDGFGSHMLLQSGLSARSECKGGVETAHYSAWIEWLPASSVTVSRPEVRPGDLMFIEVWSVSAVQGYAYLYNHSLRQGAVYALTPRSPADALQGGSVEWIVERPARDKAYEKLANYSAASMPFGVAWNYRASAPAYYYPGAPPRLLQQLPATLHLLTMRDDGRKIVSTPTVENDHFLFFQNSGSSASAER